MSYFTLALITRPPDGVLLGLGLGLGPTRLGLGLGLSGLDYITADKWSYVFRPTSSLRTPVELRRSRLTATFAAVWPEDQPTLSCSSPPYWQPEERPALRVRRSATKQALAVAVTWALTVTLVSLYRPRGHERRTPASQQCHRSELDQSGSTLPT